MCEGTKSNFDYVYFIYMNCLMEVMRQPLIDGSTDFEFYVGSHAIIFI